MTTGKENKPHYYGHRQRLRERYIKNGIDSLLEHEIIEYLLFYSVPRIDTKPLAHKLLDSYGSISNLFNASYESLCSFGLSEASASLITLHSDINHWIRRKKVIGVNLDSYEEIGRLMVSELDGHPTERLVMLMLDAKNNAIELKTLCEGSFKSTQLNMKALNESVVLRRAAKVVIAHNHPSGKLESSTEDLVATDAIEGFLAYTGVELVEHYIVADGTYMGIKWQMAQREKEKELLYRSRFGLDKDFE